MCEQMLNTNHQGNVNENHNEILPFISQSSCHQIDSEWWQGCGEKEPSCLVRRIVNWSSAMENGVEFPQKIKNRATP